MLSLSEYAHMDGVALAATIRSGELSPSEAVDAALRAIDAVNPNLNIITGLVQPPAKMESVSPDAPFRGVPYLLKDLAHGWPGVRDDKGSRLTQGFIESHETVFAARSRHAGLVAVARTNTPEFGMNGTTEPVLYGPTANPWDVTRSPGGSSGGSAAAVAAGVTPFAYANDGGGSIRLPAAWCGLVGLKPSRGLNPRQDVTDWILAEHVVSRTVRDTAAMLDVTAGSADGAYIKVLPERGYAASVEREPGPLRVGLSRNLKNAPPVDEACLRSVDLAASTLERLGHTVFEAVPGVEYDEICQLCSDMYTPSIVPYIDAMGRTTGRTPGPDTLEPPAWTTYQRGMSTSAVELISCLHKLAQMSTTVDTFMKSMDVWLTPAVSQVPCPTGKFDPTKYEIGDPTFWHREMAMYTFLPLPSITGQPGLVLPVRGDEGDLPTGIQIVGAQMSETTLFQLAGQLERELPWSARRPAVHVAQDA